MEIELEREIEEIRKVKRVTHDDNSKIGYLESIKKKVVLSELGLPIKFVEGSIKNEELTEVYKFINSNF